MTEALAILIKWFFVLFLKKWKLSVTKRKENQNERKAGTGKDTEAEVSRC